MKLMNEGARMERRFVRLEWNEGMKKIREQKLKGEEMRETEAKGFYYEA